MAVVSGLPADIAPPSDTELLPPRRSDHSVVLDGYRSDGAFHMNPGWGVQYQVPPTNPVTAWYYLPSINTQHVGQPWDFELV
jgi:hypothetical protein